MVNGKFFHQRWIFLDLDDTLWNFSRNSLDSLQSLYYTEQSVSDSFPSAESFIDVYHFHNSDLWSQYHHGLISAEYLRSERFLRTLQEVASQKNLRDEALRLDALYLSRLVGGKELVVGAEEFLKRVADKYLIGIISNGFLDTQYHKIFNTCINKYVQRLIVSDEIGIAKPDRRIFGYAIEETGADSGQAVMIGDNPETDVLGALKAGWKAIYFNPDNKPLPDYLATYQGFRMAGSLAQIAEILIEQD